MTKLDRYLKISGRRKSSFARQIGTTPTYLGILAKGGSTPTIQMAYRIERATGGLVTLYDWLTLAEVEAIKSSVPEPLIHKDQLK